MWWATTYLGLDVSPVTIKPTALRCQWRHLFPGALGISGTSHEDPGVLYPKVILYQATSLQRSRTSHYILLVVFDYLRILALQKSLRVSMKTPLPM